jgi:predicted amidohydrolase
MMHASAAVGQSAASTNPEAGKAAVQVALIQFHSASANPAENQAKAEGFVREAARNGAQFILLPELYRTMLPRDQMPQYAETIPDGPTSRRWAGLAKELGVWLLGGSMIEPVEGQPGKLYNTAVLFSDSGDLAARYRKIHLFDVCVPGVVDFQESALISSGKETATVASPFGKLGLSVCYDLRFPELFRHLAKQGMDILCLPAAFNYGTGQKHWLHLLKARAIENQCFVLAPNQVGEAPNKFKSWGHSLILDPWGDIVAEGGDGEEIVYGKLDLSLLGKYREALPSLKHIRKDIFHV